jgi:hypothetical protein
MSLKDWESYGWLKKYKTSAAEISDLFEIVERDLKAAQTKGLPADWKFGIAYNAALKLCTILLNAEGYRPENVNAHFRTLQAISEILGDKRKSDADYLNTCRSQRNTVEYDHIDGATEDDASELIEYSQDLKLDVLEYLTNKYPDLLAKPYPSKKPKR